ncbi:hypothetical protein [Rufibacter sp. DG15C]|uniref:hypothetical protein n=1 Tax=Rufibacter sp. DG15C TaxID=1379909 RepID=UPI000AEB79D4|nr:hypothetical protein [Rufibacter sp. DG15C]
MKKLFLLAAFGMFAFASCKSTCPAYAVKSDRAADQKVLVKSNHQKAASTQING